MTTSAAPMTTSAAPMTTSAAPMTTSAAPMTTSAAPQNGGDTTDDPMDTNWGGAEQTRQRVSDGKYKENNVKVAVNTD